MTDGEKKQEEKVFTQEISQEELESVSGGDCGRPEYMNGPCPKGASYIQRCPNSVNSMIEIEIEEKPKPIIPEAVLIEEVIKEEDK